MNVKKPGRGMKEPTRDPVSMIIGAFSDFGSASIAARENFEKNA